MGRAMTEMNQQIVKVKPSLVSLRIKLLFGFTILFSLVFAAAFYWFYSFTTEKAMKRVFEDMQETAIGAAEEIDVNELLELYQSGQVPADPKNLPNDLRYKEQLAWFNTVHHIEPRAWPYTFVVVNSNQGDASGLKPGAILSSVQTRPALANSGTLAQLAPDQTPLTVFLADLWVYFDRSKAASFLEVSTASQYTLRAYREGRTVNRPLYSDGQFGSWISTYVPLKNEAGQTVAILGVDFEADYVQQVQEAIKDKIVIAFLLTYGSLFILVYIVSDVLTKPIVSLTKIAAQISEGYYENNVKIISPNFLRDEIKVLAEVFMLMVSKVRLREEGLKQQVEELKIEIDQAKRQSQVNEITDTDFFQDLQRKARKLRQQSGADSNEPLAKEPDEIEGLNRDETKDGTKDETRDETVGSELPKL
jgi:ribosomal protein L12E/L44/L45/RPP1/RPP2